MEAGRGPAQRLPGRTTGRSLTDRRTLGRDRAGRPGVPQRTALGNRPIPRGACLAGGAGEHSACQATPASQRVPGAAGGACFGVAPRVRDRAAGCGGLRPLPRPGTGRSLLRLPQSLDLPGPTRSLPQRTGRALGRAGTGLAAGLPGRGGAAMPGRRAGSPAVLAGTASRPAPGATATSSRRTPSRAVAGSSRTGAAQARAAGSRPAGVTGSGPASFLARVGRAAAGGGDSAENHGTGRSHHGGDGAAGQSGGGDHAHGAVRPGQGERDDRPAARRVLDPGIGRGLLDRRGHGRGRRGCGSLDGYRLGAEFRHAWCTPSGSRARPGL